MTQPTPPPPPGQADAYRAELLERLKKISADAVGKAAASAEGLSEEDAARLKRKTRHYGHETRAKIRRAFSWVLFWLVCAGLTVAVVGFFWLLWDWIDTFKADSTKLGNFLATVFSYVLIVLATLFIEGVLRNRDDD